MNEVNILRQACCAFRNVFMQFVKMDIFHQAITISSIFQHVVPVDVSETGHCTYYPERGYRIGHRQSVEALQWVAYIGRTRNTVTRAGN